MQMEVRSETAQEWSPLSHCFYTRKLVAGGRFELTTFGLKHVQERVAR
jgi:hypothetical protein